MAAIIPQDTNDLVRKLEKENVKPGTLLQVALVEGTQLLANGKLPCYILFIKERMQSSDNVIGYVSELRNSRVNGSLGSLFLVQCWNPIRNEAPRGLTADGVEIKYEAIHSFSKIY